jgi:hypothetical protein
LQYKLAKSKVKSERSKMVMKDFSALVGEDDDAQAAREAFAAAVEAELIRGASGSGPSCWGPWFGCILRGFCRFSPILLSTSADTIDLGPSGNLLPPLLLSLERPRGIPM